MYTYRARALKIIDADTLDLDVDVGFGIHVQHRFRIRDYDAPETYRPKSIAEREHGQAAVTRTFSLVQGKDLLVTTYKLGIYGRYGADIQLPDGRDYATVMREEGFQKREVYEG